MARKKRSTRINICHHVMLRGIDGKSIFKDDSDKSRFCLMLQEASELHSFRVHAFCLMTTHLHLIIEPLKVGLSKGVHRFASRYAQHFNGRFKRRGYVFQGRFKSILVEDGVYLRRLTRYIHLNPVEAGLVKEPEDYMWSSHNAYFGRSQFVWLEIDRVLSHFGDNRFEALINLAKYMNEKIDSEESAEEIHKSFRKGVYGGEEFMRVYAPDALKNSLAEGKGVSLNQVIEKISEKFGVSFEQLCSSEKNPNIVDARAVLARVTQKLEDFSLGDVSRILKKNHGTISRLASLAKQKPNLQSEVDEFVTFFARIA